MFPFYNELSIVYQPYFIDGYFRDTIRIHSKVVKIDLYINQ